MMRKLHEPVNQKALFLSACRCEPVERVPVWIMRQAGRYLPEYRAIRLKHNFMEVCKTPELAIEVSLQPHRILGVDAVIVFSDILITAGAMGLPFELSDRGPVIEHPLRTAAQIHELSSFDPEQETRFLMDAIRGLVRELGPDVPVLGFAAAPWTLACYMIEGHGKDGFPAAKTMLYSDPELFRNLLERIARGASSKEAGRDLAISPRTVEVHRARIMEKLGAKNAADLMRIVLGKGTGHRAMAMSARQTPS